MEKESGWTSGWISKEHRLNDIIVATVLGFIALMYGLSIILNVVDWTKALIGMLFG